jgi:exodeoxyribonuclease-5
MVAEGASSGTVAEGEVVMIFSPDQDRALAAVEAWLRGTEKRCTLGGYAGTGKSTLVQEIIRRVGGRVSVCAYTGKAAYNLRLKGVLDASTIHRLIYTPFDFCKVCEKEAQYSWDAVTQRKTLIDKDVRFCCCGEDLAQLVTKFRRAPILPWPLIIVDEASMVGKALMEDLESFNVRVLYVGDHGQLQPIGDDARIMANLDIRLEKIHRQAAGSPIIQFAHHVREGNAPESFGAAARVQVGLPTDLDKFDAVICGYNKTRVAVNARVREARGYSGTLPEPGERIICLRNDAGMGLFNGMLATVRKINSGSSKIDIEDETGQVISGLPFARQQFGSETTLSEETPRDFSLWDFGYCMTAHKSQGSGWPRVAVLEQIHRDTAPTRWRYTAATRASEELVYCLSARR